MKFAHREQADGSVRCTFDGPFRLSEGGVLPEVSLVYETYGQRAPKGDNVILVQHALSTGHHLCAHPKNPDPGWWEAMVGPGKAIDTDRFFVIGTNNLGSCFGSTGPTSLNPATGRPYGPDFPKITVQDMVHAQRQLLESMGIARCYAVVGSSMGGMAALLWAMLHPEAVQRLVAISSCYKAYPLNVAWHEIQRAIIALDRAQGFTLARKIGHLNYRGAQELTHRFQEPGRLSSYLAHNAQKFVDAFDVDTYVCITEAMDRFDVSAEHLEAPEEAFRAITAAALVISVHSDVLFPPFQQAALAQCLEKAGVSVAYKEHRSHRGHDAFYGDADIGAAIAGFLSCDPKPVLARSA